MALHDLEGSVVRTGSYQYGSDARKLIRVVAYAFDYLFEMQFDNGREDGSPQPLGPDGRLYYLLPEETDALWMSFNDETAARKWADEQPWGPVVWE